jgi:arsenate reductase
MPNCDICRKARKWLTDSGRQHHFHDLRKDGLDMQMLERWADRLDWQSLLNTRSLTWRKIPPDDRADLNRDRAIALMLDQPTLVKRPLLEWRELVTVGFSAASYEQVFALS